MILPGFVDVEKMKMWEPLQALLQSNSSEAIKMQTLWVMGTAIQNNPSAQQAVRFLCYILLYMLIRCLFSTLLSRRCRLCSNSSTPP